MNVTRMMIYLDFVDDVIIFFKYLNILHNVIRDATEKGFSKDSSASHVQKLIFSHLIYYSYSQ